MWKSAFSGSLWWHFSKYLKLSLSYNQRRMKPYLPPGLGDRESTKGQKWNKVFPVVVKESSKGFSYDIKIIVSSQDKACCICSFWETCLYYIFPVSTLWPSHKLLSVPSSLFLSVSYWYLPHCSYDMLCQLVWVSSLKEWSLDMEDFTPDLLTHSTSSHAKVLTILCFYELGLSWIFLLRVNSMSKFLTRRKEASQGNYLARRPPYKHGFWLQACSWCVSLVVPKPLLYLQITFSFFLISLDQLFS